jgi:hypothetical protein
MTVLTCYQQPDTETQREALAKRKRYRAGSGGWVDDSEESARIGHPLGHPPRKFL